MESTSPTRLDFSGGTLDLYPLYLLHKGTKVINMAIDINTICTIKNIYSEKSKIISGDHKNEIEFREIINSNDFSPSLVDRVVLYFSNLLVESNERFELKTYSSAPKGSGLGASSSLLISSISAISNYLQIKMTTKEKLQIAQDIETSHIKVPTGQQDFIAALHGGLNSINFNVGGYKLTPLIPNSKFHRELEERSILVYSGVSHFSAQENWLIYKKRIDGNFKITKLFESIKKISHKMEKSILNSDFNTFAELLQREWDLRIQLHPSIENKEVKKIRTQLGEYSVYLKGCGAGNGGCFIIISEKEDRNEIKTKLNNQGIKILDFKKSKSGVSTKIS